jgi:hypothetical protein
VTRLVDESHDSGKQASRLTSAEYFHDGHAGLGTRAVDCDQSAHTRYGDGHLYRPMTIGELEAGRLTDNRGEPATTPVVHQRLLGTPDAALITKSTTGVGVSKSRPAWTRAGVPTT